MGQWFEEWFESPEYLTVYKKRDDADAFELVSLILSLTNIRESSSVLDLACGAGRHSILFAERGMNVMGIDLSKNLLKLAVEKATESNLKINFINEDIRKLKLDKKFDLVVNLFTSFGYFETDKENFTIFEKAAEHLLSNGVFVFDYFNTPYLIENLKPHSIDKIGDTIFEQIRNIRNNRVEKKIEITGKHRKSTYHESVKMYSANELVKQLKKSGFTKIGLYGDYKGSIFDQKKSQRFLAVCQKQ